MTNLILPLLTINLAESIRHGESMEEAIVQYEQSRELLPPVSQESDVAISGTAYRIATVSGVSTKRQLLPTSRILK